MRVALGFLVLVLSVLSGGAFAGDWYEARGARPPDGNRLYICHGYSCRIVTPVQLTPGEAADIAAPLSAPLPDAAAERAALSTAVQIFELIVGGRIGTSADLPEMQIGRAKADQMDCVDEATNTTSLLR